MEEIYFATRNRGKFTYYNEKFQKYGLRLSQAELDLPEPRSDDLRVIAREKVLYAYDRLRKPCLALDAGFFITSLNGFPRAFVNFTLETIGIEGILRLAEGKPRHCEFRNCIAYMDGSIDQPVLFESGIRGTLSEAKRGQLSAIDWSELSLIFIPEGASKTLGEMTIDERSNLLSQRWGASYKEVADWLYKRNGN